MKVFSISTLTGDVIHLGTEDKIPLCGGWLFEPELSDEIDIVQDDLDNICKNCLKSLKTFE